MGGLFHEFFFWEELQKSPNQITNNEIISFRYIILISRIFFKQNILCLSFQVGKGKCGGVLVDRRHVVTAGHCVKNKVLSSIAVTLGEYHLKSSREPLPSQSYRYFSMFCILKPLSDLFFYFEFNIYIFLPFFP